MKRQLEADKYLKLCNPLNKKLVVSRDVIFYEAEAWNWGESQTPTQSVILEEPGESSTSIHPATPTQKLLVQLHSNSTA